MNELERAAYFKSQVIAILVIMLGLMLVYGGLGLTGALAIGSVYRE